MGMGKVLAMTHVALSPQSIQRCLHLLAHDLHEQCYRNLSTTDTSERVDMDPVTQSPQKKTQIGYHATECLLEGVCRDP